MLRKFDKLAPYATSFIAKTIGRANNAAYYHTIGSRDLFNQEWKSAHKMLLAKHLTENTVVPTNYSTRENAPRDKSRPSHEATKYFTNQYYDPKAQDAIDRIPVHCPEHLMLMRMAIGISRNPEANTLKVMNAVAGQLVQLLSSLDKTTLRSIFTVGGNIEESRSINLINNIDTWLETLTDYKNLPISKLSRILETVISPLGTILNTFGTPHCLINKAQKKGTDIGRLEEFILSLEADCKKYYIPYIKGSDGPFFHLSCKQYIEGEDLYPQELVTLNHYIENCEDLEMDYDEEQEIVAKTPNLRRLKIIDPTSRSQLLHVGLNVPHYFDVSGTTGAAMQAIMGILSLANQQQLLATSDDYRRFGMIFAGCNFTKQGYHNFYEVFPSLEWGVENIYKERGLYHLQPAKLVDSTGKLLKKCVDPSSNMQPIINDATDIFTEHSLLHYQQYKKSLELDAKNLSSMKMPIN